MNFYLDAVFFLDGASMAALNNMLEKCSVTHIVIKIPYFSEKVFQVDKLLSNCNVHYTEDDCPIDFLGSQHWGWSWAPDE